MRAGMQCARAGMQFACARAHADLTVSLIAMHGTTTGIAPPHIAFCPAMQNSSIPVHGCSHSLRARACKRGGRALARAAGRSAPRERTSAQHVRNRGFSDDCAVVLRVRTGALGTVRVLAVLLYLLRSVEQLVELVLGHAAHRALADVAEPLAAKHALFRANPKQTRPCHNSLLLLLLCSCVRARVRACVSIIACARARPRA